MAGWQGSVPTPLLVYHAKFTPGQTDAHNNPVDAWGPYSPVNVQAINEFGARGSSHEIIGDEYFSRTELTYEMGVPTDGSEFGQRDYVVIGNFVAGQYTPPQVDVNGNPTTGLLFHVEGIASNNKIGPFQLCNNLLGAAVRMRRIT